MFKKNFYKWFKAALAIISIILLVLDFAAIIDINSRNSKWFWLNNFILIILAIDYFSRLYLAKNKKVFFRNNIFELLAIIPVGLAFSWMKLAQLGDIGLYFRLLRLIRLAGLVGMLKDILHTHGILYVIYFSIAFLMLGSVAISITEHVSLDQAFWWAITTASTVGYGDISKHTISPQSLLGKLVILAMILIGVGIKVFYDIYDSNEVLDEKVMKGNTGYDLVVPGSDFLAKQIKAGVYRKLDKDNIPNWKNLDPVQMRHPSGHVCRGEPHRRYL